MLQQMADFIISKVSVSVQYLNRENIDTNGCVFLELQISVGIFYLSLAWCSLKEGDERSHCLNCKTKMVIVLHFINTTYKIFPLISSHQGGSYECYLTVYKRPFPQSK